MEKVPTTAGGLRTLEEELKQLKSVERPAIIKAIAAAREHGDLSENAEYTAARERQSFIEGRIAEIEVQLAQTAPQPSPDEQKEPASVVLVVARSMWKSYAVTSAPRAGDRGTFSTPWLN